MEITNSFQKVFFNKHNFLETTRYLLKNRERIQLTITGDCMTPLLKKHDLVTVKSTHVDQLLSGDIVVFLFNEEFKAHRFIKLKTIEKQEYIITKSDRRKNYDPPVSITNFIGKVILVKNGTKTINYESRKWNIINHILGKLSPYLSFVEHYLLFPIRLPRKCASWLFRLIMGTNYRNYIKKRKTLRKQRRANILYK